MSLKEFHTVFITASVLLAFGFSYWGVVQAQLLTSVLSFLSGIGLVLYEISFIKKTRNS